MMTMSRRKRYTNDENLRACQYCGARRKGRGMRSHVKKSGDAKHGPTESVPDDWDIKKCPVVGEAKVSIDRVKGYQDDHSRWTCSVCGEIFKGKSGLGRHLSCASDPRHRAVIDTDEEIDYSQHTVFPATEDGRILVPDEERVGDVVAHLTEEEMREYSVVVDEDAFPGEEVGEVADEFSPLEKEELLDDIKASFMARMIESDNPETWVEAYQEVEDVFSEGEE